MWNGGSGPRQRARWKASPRNIERGDRVQSPGMPKKKEVSQCIRLVLPRFPPFPRGTSQRAAYQTMRHCKWVGKLAVFMA